LADKSIEISQQDETKLRWYFGARGSGLEGSNAAPQFDRIRNDNAAGFECPVCEGDGYLDCGNVRAKKCDRCNGNGRIERAVKGAHIPRTGYVECQLCDGVTGANPECSFCGGEGYSMVLSAFCLHEDEAIAYIDAEAPLFVKQGEMLRILAKLTGDLRARGERYYGPEGDRWARTERGRIFCLYDFTAAGKRLLCASPKAHGELTKLERIAMLAEADKRFPERERTRLLANAYLEAHDLIDEFAASWVESNGGAHGHAA
jgi:hypothetical protein